MNIEQNLDLVADRIVLDAPEQKIDFADPANVFTVWADLRNRMQYCGSRQSLDGAWMLAAGHVHLRNTYVVKGPLSEFGIMKFERARA